MVINIESIKNALALTTPVTIDDVNLVPAGVLILLYPRDGNLCVLLNKRTDRVEHHKGEISFPGGAQDPGDATILDTALRETHEEMGIDPRDVDVICRLDQVSTRTGFAITPFVGVIPSAYHFNVSRVEVAEVLQVPLSALLDPANRLQEMRVGDNGLSRQYSYVFGEHLIWGATARMLTQLLGLIAPDLR
ncbi:MAG: CoA pyrophosphatase [Chloroflexi bacterium]|nr:CoA pyrophosphatase [Chloroflexota bacterium]